VSESPADASTLRPQPGPAAARAEVEAAIPHRDPFLFVDRIVEHRPDSIRVAWTVPADAPFFAGHFPGQPVTPGVLLCEHAFQAAAVLISRALGGFSAEDGVPVLTKLGDARFRRRVDPGETLDTTVEVEERVGPAWYLRATVRAGGRPALRVRFTLTATGAIARAVRGTAGGPATDPGGRGTAGA